MYINSWFQLLHARVGNVQKFCSDSEVLQEEKNKERKRKKKAALNSLVCASSKEKKNIYKLE